MKSILNLDKIKELESKLSDFVINDMTDLNIDYLEKINWIAVPIVERPFCVPFEDESFYNDSFFKEEKDIKSFTTALQKAGYLNCYVLTEVIDPPEKHCLELEITEKDISSFNYEYSHLYSVILPKDYSFIILWVDDYSIITGKKDFVESLTGCDLETAMNVFKEESSTGWTEYAKESGYTEMKALLKLYEKYKVHNEKVLKALEGKEP